MIAAHTDEGAIDRWRGWKMFTYYWTVQEPSFSHTWNNNKKKKKKLKDK